MDDPAPSPAGPLRFPPGFLWGAATSAFQIEGSTTADGRGASIWDRFCRQPGRVAGGASGEPACDHYRRWPEDVALMARLGLRAYRFSLAWPRILPRGGGRVNQAGLDFYRRLVAALHVHGIVPVATLYHWDLPQPLQEQGGWAARDTALRFAEYAALLFDRLGAEVPLWVTINEPMLITYAGYAGRAKAPGAGRPFQSLAVAHHLLLAHGLAVRAFRQSAVRPAAGLPAPGIGIVLNLRPCHPASPRPRAARAAATLDALTNRLFLAPLFRGHYPADALRFFRRRLVPLPAAPDDLAIIATPADFLGLNVYVRVLAAAGNPLTGPRQVPGPGPRTALGWEIYPPCISEAIALAREYTPLPLYLTENGAAFADRPAPDGTIDDRERIAYLQAHIAEAHRALMAGADLRGYFVWSLLDNFEWEHGYAPRFGLIHVDFTTQARRLKASAGWYADVIARNGLLLE